MLINGGHLGYSDTLCKGPSAGADPGFEVREGAHLRNLRRAEGGIFSIQ
jgi:hypothetical protein